MLKAIFLAVLILAVVAWLTRAPRVRRALWAVLLLIAAYGILKATGVIDALAPSRTGVL